MTLNPRTILILFAISLQGCDGGGSTPPPTPPPVEHLVSINIQQISPSTLSDGGKPVNELPGKEVVFKAYGHYDNTDKVPDITSKVTWGSSDYNVIRPTSTPGHYKTISPGEAYVYASMARLNEDPAESNHITKNVPEPHPYKIVIRKLDEDKLVNDKIPKGLKVSYGADIYWDSGPVRESDGTNDVTWKVEGDGFKQDNKQKNLFYASGEVGSQSTLTASYEGISSDDRTLEVSNPILKKLQIEVDGGQSTSVPRGQDRTLKAEAVFEDDGGVDVTKDVTKDVSWNSVKNPAFEQKDNTFRAIGSKGNVGIQTSITASLSNYPSQPSNQVILTISPAELVGVRTEIDKGANAQVPRYLSRTLKAIGVYKGDVSGVSGVSGSDKTFEEDITSTVASWTNSDESSFEPIQGTSNRFQAVGKPGSTSVVTPELPNFKDSKGIKLSVIQGVITGLEIEHADAHGYSDNVPKNQTRKFRVMATFDSASGNSPKEDVTGDSELIISDDSFEKINNDTVQAVGNPGESAVVSADYSGQSTDNNFTLTAQKEQSDIIMIGSKIFTKPTKRMNYADAQEYCSNLGGTLPSFIELDQLVQEYVGPNHGWPWWNQESYGTYWTNVSHEAGTHEVVQLYNDYFYDLSDLLTSQVSCVVPAVGAMRQ